MDQLKACLLELVVELSGVGIPVTVGGGFGLYLKRSRLEETGTRTLFDELPEPGCATNDLDLFIRAEVLAELGQARRIVGVIRTLGYEPVETAKFMQWVKPVPVGGVTQEVKIDLLVGPLGENATRMKADERRARPKGDIELHGRRTEEAIGIDEGQYEIPISGTDVEGVVYVPAGFPYLMMKLAAFGDRKGDREKNLGRHHALDLYTIVGMMTEVELEHAIEMGRENATDSRVRHAGELVVEDFSAVTAPGVIRLREHPSFRPDFRLTDFMDVLKDVFDC